MQPKYFSLCAFLILAFSAMTPAVAAPATDLAQIQAGYNQQNRAAETKNVELFLKTLSPTFKGVDQNGQPTSLQQARKDMADLFGTVTHISGHTTITAFTIKTRKAYITTQEHDDVVMADPRTLKPMTMVDDEVDHDVWIKVNGVWLEQTSDSVSDRTSVKQGPG